MRYEPLALQIIKLTLISLFFLSCSNNNKGNIEDKNTQEINTIKSIHVQLQTLASDNFNGRETGTNGLLKARDYITKYFKTENISPYYSSYIDTFYTKEKIPAYNIIAKVNGTEDYLKNEPVIISAHYDHIGVIKAKKGDSIANGANDNAAGTVGVLQLAKLLKDTKPKRPILFILFDAEEQGLLGSKYLAEKLKSEGIKPYIVFNIEMIGVPMLNKPSIAYLTGHERSNFAEVFNSYTKREALEFSKIAKQYNLFMQSDNLPFYSVFNIPSHTASTFDFSNFDHYHQVGDEADLMNSEHIYNLVTGWKNPLLKISNHTERLIKLTEIR